MTPEKNSTAQPLHPASLSKRMLIGAGIALALIALFLLPIRDPDPEWGPFWVVRPFLIVPLAGAMGALCSHILDSMRYRYGWNKILTIIVSILIYIIGLWMGVVLGLHGTLWN